MANDIPDALCCDIAVLWGDWLAQDSSGFPSRPSCCPSSSQSGAGCYDMWRGWADVHERLTTSTLNHGMKVRVDTCKTDCLQTASWFMHSKLRMFQNNGQPSNRRSIAKVVALPFRFPILHTHIITLLLCYISRCILLIADKTNILCTLNLWITSTFDIVNA